MIVCTKCGFLNADGVEFCANPQHCGAYLDHVGKKLDPLPGGIAVTLTPSLVAVQPGGEAACEIRVRNRSNIVDQLEVQVLGDPAAWTVAEPTSLSLFPDAEGTVKLRFRPVRSSEVPAGRTAFSVRVQSRASPTTTASQDGFVEVAPFAEATLSVVPRTARGGRSTTHRVVIENHGNGPLRASLEASDPDDLLAFEFDRPTLQVPAGGTTFAQLTVRPPGTFFEGAPQPHSFKVQLRSDGAPPVSADGIMLQEPVDRPAPLPPPRKFPVVPVILGLLVVAAIAGAVVEREPLLRLVGVIHPASPAPSGRASAAPTPKPAATPSPTPVVLVTVPNVACDSQLVAEQAITSAGLKFVANPVDSGSYPAGTVISTQPAGGASAPLGSAVTANVATGPLVQPSGIRVLDPCLLLQIPPSAASP